MKNKLSIPKPKKFKKTTAKNKLDKLFSLKVRSRGNQLEGVDGIKSGGPLQCMHVIGRGNLFLRWNEKNAISGDAGHHVYYTFHPEAWRELMMRINKENYEWLLANRNTKITFNETYYKQKLEELKGK